VPNGIDRKLQRTQKNGNVLHFADSFVCQSPLRIFFFGFRFSVLSTCLRMLRRVFVA
jgi:hypothetical protein